MEVAAEESNPHEGGLLGHRRHLGFDDIGSLILTLCGGLVGVDSPRHQSLHDSLHPCEAQSHPFQQFSRQQGVCGG